MEIRTTKISRSWGATIGYLIGAVFALGVSVLLFMSIVEGPISLGIALIPAIIALFLLYSSFGGAGTGSCPICDSPLSGLSTKSNDGVVCRNCHRYSEGQGGLLRETDENRVAAAPMFSTLLPAQFAFPAGCCVCGGLEVNRETISLQSQNASSVITAPTVGVTTDTTVSIVVPHCAQHRGGAQLTGSPQRPHIMFRSYPYLRAFCQLNGATPG
jgi:hypothetical protein